MLDETTQQALGVLGGVPRGHVNLQRRGQRFLGGEIVEEPLIASGRPAIDQRALHLDPAHDHSRLTVFLGQGILPAARTWTGAEETDRIDLD